MTYAVLSIIEASTDKRVDNLIAAELPGAVSLIQAGLMLAECGDRPVAVGDLFDGSRFWRETDDEDGKTRREEILSPSVQTVTGTAASLAKRQDESEKAQADGDALAVDHELRLALLELGLDETAS